MHSLQKFSGKRPGKLMTFLAALAMSLLTGCASSQPSPSPYMYTGAGLGRSLGGRHRGRRQSQQSLERSSYRRFAGRRRGWCRG